MTESEIKKHCDLIENYVKEIVAKSFKNKKPIPKNVYVVLPAKIHYVTMSFKFTE